MHIAVVGYVMYGFCVIAGYLFDVKVTSELIGTTVIFILFGICLELAKLNKKKG